MEVTSQEWARFLVHNIDRIVELPLHRVIMGLKLDQAYEAHSSSPYPEHLKCSLMARMCVRACMHKMNMLFIVCGSHVRIHLHSTGIIKYIIDVLSVSMCVYTPIHNI